MIRLLLAAPTIFSLKVVHPGEEVKWPRGFPAAAAPAFRETDASRWPST
jgi:hypothetical protein